MREKLGEEAEKIVFLSGSEKMNVECQSIVSFSVQAGNAASVLKRKYQKR